MTCSEPSALNPKWLRFRHPRNSGPGPEQRSGGAAARDFLSVSLVYFFRSWGWLHCLRQLVLCL